MSTSQGSCWPDPGFARARSPRAWPSAAREPLSYGQLLVESALLALGGLTIGSLGAIAAVQLLRSFLWGVGPTDPLTFAAVISSLLVVALFASLLPALRVLRLDPAQTLRAE